MKYKEKYYTISTKNLRVFSVCVGQNKEDEDKSQICIFMSLPYRKTFMS